ncbi:TonB-dependent receptor [Saccharicrinis aurantiacus]|uniref:TonB-dependent receptor n=1 Tax=Saccharicrinis aurantiacus TaxID=1849719 RepID=UPI0024921FA8|nr:TonB-dependent receptor [Saccharicrinis aurantiacus]
MIISRLQLLIALFLLSINLLAEPIIIKGKVCNQNQKALSNAHILLAGDNNYSITTDEQGNFIFSDVPVGDYTIQISYLGYAVQSKKLSNINTNSDVGTITLLPKANELDEVIVKKNVPLATVSGDSIQYNADAYKVNPDADAEDLIKKMPGITVSNGTVEAQGEEVKKVYVDGKEFFDQDPTLALKSIPADIIQSIEVFDEMSEQSRFTGFDDGNTTKVMNVVTRATKKNGQFGHMYIGSDGIDKYSAGGNINFFNGDRRISIVGQSNNINKQDFSNDDLLGAIGSSGNRKGGGFKGGPGGGRPGGGGGSSNSNSMVGQQDGVSTTHSLGLNYADQWGEKIKVSGSYFFNQSDNLSEQDIYQNYFVQDDGFNQYYTETNEANSTNYNHRFNFRFDYDINDNNKLLIIPRFSFQGNNSESNILGSSFINDTLVNKTENMLSTDMAGYSLGNEIVWMHKFSKKGRTFSLSGNTTYNSKQSDSYQMSRTIEDEMMLPSDSLNQYTDYSNPKTKVGAKVVYTEPMGRYSQLMLNANSNYTFDDGDRNVFDYNYDGGDYTDHNTDLSNVFTSVYATHRAGGGYMYKKNKTFLTVGLDYQYSTLESEQQYPELYTISKSFHSILPNIRFKTNLAWNKNLMVFYNSSTQQPTVSQLQNTIDNSNPLQLTMGNPNLNESTNHRLMARYTSSNMDNGTMFFIMGSAQYTQNYIGNNTLFATRDTVINNSITLPQGSQLITPENMDNYWNVRLMSSYGVPINPIKTNLNMSLGYRYTHTPGIYNDEEIYSDDNTFTAGVTLASNISENVDFTISSNSSYNLANSSLQSEQNNNYYNQNTTGELSLIFWKGFVFRASCSHQYYYWTDNAYKESFFILNGELGKKFLKNQAAEIKLTVYDALNQNQNITRNVTDAYIEDIRTNALQRYVMLSFTYRLRNFNIK